MVWYEHLSSSLREREATNWFDRNRLVFECNHPGHIANMLGIAMSKIYSWSYKLSLWILCNTIHSVFWLTRPNMIILNDKLDTFGVLNKTCKLSKCQVDSINLGLDCSNTAKLYDSYISLLRTIGNPVKEVVLIKCFKQYWTTALYQFSAYSGIIGKV